MTRFFSIALAAGTLLATSASSLAEDGPPNVNAETLLGFCSGDESYGPHALPGCLHYAHGVMDAMPSTCMPFNSSDLLRGSLLA